MPSADPPPSPAPIGNCFMQVNLNGGKFWKILLQKFICFYAEIFSCGSVDGQTGSNEIKRLIFAIWTYRFECEHHESSQAHL